jgi:ATP-binding cassette subfamily B protein
VSGRRPDPQEPAARTGTGPAPGVSRPGERNGTPNPWWVLWRLARNQPLRYLSSLAAWVTIWTMPVALGLLAQRYFDGLTGDPGGWAAGDVAVALLVWATAYAGAILAGMRLHASLIVRARSSVQRRMLGWVFGLPAARPVATSPGETVSRFRDDTEHLQEAFDFSVDFVGSIVSAVVAFVLLALVDPLLAVAVFTPVLLTVAVVRALGKRIRRYRIAARETTEQVTGFLGETFGAAAAVKVAGAEAPLLARFAQLNDQRRTMMVRDRTLTAATDALVANTADIAIGVVLLLAAGTIGDAGGLSVGDVALFTVLLGRVTFAAYMSGQFLARVRQAGVSVERMVDLLPGATTADLFVHQPMDERTRGAAAVELAPRPDAPLLEVRGLTCRHPGGGGVTDVDLVVDRGELVVVTGPVGSGKTTLLRAVLGLLPVDAGTVAWEGHVLDDPAATLVPPRVATTPQVPRLFTMDLRDNLDLGHGADDGALLDAMRAATLDVDLDGMPHGLDTRVGPRGLRLSGGQVQRAAAARMLVRRPQLLVFDDISSALDVETEALLWDRLFTGDGAATALVVSHRRPALMRADRIVVLDAGRVAAVGTAEELRAGSAAFRELWG